MTAAHPIPAQTYEEFIESKRIDRGASDHTIAAYRSDLAQFQTYLQQHPPTDPDTLTPTIEAYLKDLHSAQTQASTIARKLTTLRQFFKFLCLEKNYPHHPLQNIGSPKQPRRLPHPISPEQVDRLLQATQQGLPYRGSQADALRARDRAMITLLYATGLRVSELLQLEPSQIFFPESYVRVRGKGSKERVVPYVPIAGEHLHAYVTQHREALHPATPHLFVNPRGFTLTRQGFWKILKALARQAEIDTPLSPHTLRHSFATHLLQSGIPLRSLQMLLGHSDLATTQIYTQVSPEKLKEAIERYHPRGSTDE